MSRVLKINGLKSIHELYNNPNRTYGIKILQHFPAEEFVLDTSKVLALESDKESILEGLPEKWFNPGANAIFIEDPIIIGNSGMVISPDGWLISESIGLSSLHLDKRSIDMPTLLSQYPSIPLDNLHKINGTSYCALNPNGGYAHHLVEASLPLVLFEENQIDNILVSSGVNSEIVKEWCSFLGRDSANFIEIEKNSCFQVSSLLFYGFNNTTFLNKEFVQLVYNKLNPTSHQDNPTRKVFETRNTNAHGNHLRYVENLNEAEQFFKSNGYEIIDPATLSFQEKLDFYNTVKVSLNIHGSGGINSILFSPPSSLVAAMVPRSLLPHIPPLGSILNFYNVNQFINVFPDLSQKYFNSYSFPLCVPTQATFIHLRKQFALMACQKTSKYHHEHSCRINLDKAERFLQLINDSIDS